VRDSTHRAQQVAIPPQRSRTYVPPLIAAQQAELYKVSHCCPAPSECAGMVYCLGEQQRLVNLLFAPLMQVLNANTLRIKFLGSFLHASLLPFKETANYFCIFNASMSFLADLTKIQPA
jgi:hypothetical protein